MDNPLYVQMTRQSGLLKEIDMIAGNLANMNTTGYRREGLVFSEYVQATSDELGSLSMTAARARFADDAQGPISQTNSPFDLAIEGDGFFQVQTNNGPRLTRAGSFTVSPEGALVTLHGYPVLDKGGAPIQLPPGLERFSVAPDGAVEADGVAIAQIGLVAPQEPQMLLMGTEQSGLTDTLAAHCTDLVKIPMAGKADSLNLAVATALALYELRRPFLR